MHTQDQLGINRNSPRYPVESLEITWDCEQKLTSLVEQHAGIVITSRENMDTKLSMKSGRRENMDMKRLEYDKILVPKI